MQTNQIELVRPVKRICFRRTENVNIQLSHLFPLGHRGILRVVVVVILHIGGVGLLDRRLTLLSLRLCRLGRLLLVLVVRVRIFCCLAAIATCSAKRLAFPFVV
jgi:hypothetical protein